MRMQRWRALWGADDVSPTPSAESKQAPAPALVRSAGSQFLTDPREIERIFKVFRDQCSPVALRFKAADGEFSARVIDVTSSQVVIDDVQPRTGMRLLREEPSFTLAGRIQGIYVRVHELRVTKIAEERHVPFFVFELPKQVLFQQRRRSARYRVPLSVSPDGARIALHRAKMPLIGYVVDISAGGCRADIECGSDPNLRQDEPIERCEIQIPRLLALNARVVIRHHHFDAAAGKLTCGIEFAAMTIGDRRRLEQFIAKISRVTTPT